MYILLPAAPVDSGKNLFLFIRLNPMLSNASRVPQSGQTSVSLSLLESAEAP